MQLYLKFVWFFIVICYECHQITVYLLIILPSLTLGQISIKPGVYGETEDEREVLLQEQRYCRARARKLSLETNRRRK